MVSSSLAKQWLAGQRCGQEGQPMGTRDKGKSMSLVEVLGTCSTEAEN